MVLPKIMIVCIWKILLDDKKMTLNVYKNISDAEKIKVFHDRVQVLQGPLWHILRFLVFVELWKKI